MALFIKLLGAMRTNAGSLTNIYSSTASTIVANIRFATTANGGTVNLFYKPNGGSAIRILDLNKSLGASDSVVVKPEITMGPGDTIEVTTGVVMDCVVSGFTRD